MTPQQRQPQQSFQQGQEAHQRFMKQVQEQNRLRTQQEFDAQRQRLQQNPPQPLDPAAAKIVRRSAGVIFLIFGVLFLVIVVLFIFLEVFVFSQLQHV